MSKKIDLNKVKENINVMIESEFRKYIRKSIKEYGLANGMSNNHAASGDEPDGIKEPIPECGCIDKQECCMNKGNAEVGSETATTLKGVDSDHGINPSNIQGGPVDSGHQEESQPIEDTSPPPVSGFEGNGDTEPMAGSEGGNQLVDPGTDMMDNLIDVPNMGSSLVVKDMDSAKKLIKLLQSREVVEGEYEGNPVQLNKLTKNANMQFEVFVEDPRSSVVKKINFG